MTGQAQPQQPPFTPHTFGKYFLVDKIATGGMAEIFKAKTFSHGGFENLLVIKRILPHIGENQDFVGMFVDEARVSVALQHPNIVRVYDFGKILDNYFIAMECVDGKDTRNLLRKMARKKVLLPERYCAFIAHEVCKGLHYAHTKTDIHGNPYGIVHRDISPSNVLVSYEGEIKIADFGIAKAESNVTHTRDGVLKGKWDYMSPEQAEGREIDHRSDLFSLGIILHETLTGRRLFKAETEVATLKKIREGVVPDPRLFRPSLPPELGRICLKALTKDLDQRYQSANEMVEDLRGFLFPDTADTLRTEFREYLQDLFAEERHDERDRLASGNALAETMRDRLSSMDWEGSGSEVTMSQVTQSAVHAVVPWIAAIGLGMLVVFGLALAFLFAFFAWQKNVPGQRTSDPQTIQVAGPSGIDVVVFPAANIFVDDVLVAEASTFTLNDVPVGEHVVRLEAEGHEPVTETVVVEAGKLVKLAKKLEQKSVQPEPASGPPVVVFRSSPSGASVVVDGNALGKAPVTWRGGTVGRNYSVEMTLDGHSLGKATRKAHAGSQTVNLTLPKVATPGLLTVVMVGGGWANVYVDGVKLKKTAPFKDVDITPGSHDIRIENPSMGLDVTERHSFGGGQAITIRAKPQ